MNESGSGVGTGPETLGVLVEGDVGCVACGYNLRGIRRSGVCPECATPVEKSMRGDLLEFASEAYVRKLYRGSVVVVGSILMSVSVIIVTMGVGILAPALALSPTVVQIVIWLATVCGMAASIGVAAGWWFLSEQNPAALDPTAGGTARRVVRVTAGIAVVTTLAQHAISFLMSGAGNTASGFSPEMGLALLLALLGLVTFAVSFFAQMSYINWLAPRLPDTWVYRRAKLMMWLGPVVFVVGAPCAMLGPIVALVLYYNLITRVRADLKGILARVHGTSGLTERL